MIVFLILRALQFLEMNLFTFIPTVDTPLWLAETVPEILIKVASFNYYLPISEVVNVVLFIIGFVLLYKIGNIIVNVFNVDLRA